MAWEHKTKANPAWKEVGNNEWCTGVAEPITNASSTVDEISELWKYNYGEPVQWGCIVSDVDADGKMEIFLYRAFSSGVGKYLTCLSYDGATVKWTGYDETSGVVIRDIDGDGTEEIFAESTKDYCTRYEHDGAETWNKTGYTNPAFMIRCFKEGTVWRIFWMDNDNYFRYWNASDGAEVWNYSVTGYSEASAVVEDVDGDGYPEIIAHPRGYNNTAVIYCFEHGGGVKYSITINQDLYGLCPVLADVNQDGVYEFLASMGNGNALKLYKATDGSLLYTKTSTAKFWIPAVADIDGDGEIEILAPCEDGYLYCLKPDLTEKWSYLVSGYKKSSPYGTIT